jgi:hypothetical protein
MFAALQGIEGMEDEEDQQGAEKAELISSSENEIDDSESSREEVAEEAEVGRKRAKRRLQPLQDEKPEIAPPETEDVALLSGEGDSLRVLGFDKNDRYNLLGFIIKRGVDPSRQRWRYLLSQVFSPAQYGQRPSSYLRLLVRCILEPISDSPHFSNGVPKAALLKIADEVEVPRDGMMQILGLHGRITSIIYIRGEDVARSDEEIALAIVSRVRVALSYGAMEFTATRTWAPHHDALLIKAVSKYGFGAWMEIFEEEDENELKASILNELTEGESPDFWIKKRVEGLDKAFKIAEDHEKQAKEQARQREALVEGLKRKLITQYNKVTNQLAKKAPGSSIQCEQVFAAYKSMFEEILAIK